ncbi:MAG: IreB family regulatory phosphoprotein [Methylocystaceae bacterium]
MPENNEGTMRFSLPREEETKVDLVLRRVYQALKEKGYNPINQLVGYMISGDPSYITSHQEARSLITKLERDEILEILIKHYLES